MHARSPPLTPVDAQRSTVRRGGGRPPARSAGRHRNQGRWSPRRTPREGSAVVVASLAPHSLDSAVRRSVPAYSAIYNRQSSIFLLGGDMLLILGALLAGLGVGVFSGLIGVGGGVIA